MPNHHEKRLLPYTPLQMFELVADVERYPEFLPWCSAARITWRDGTMFNADVTIGYKIFNETFNSTVTLFPHDRIEVSYKSGPMSHLFNHWGFTPAKRGKDLLCEVEFYIDFQFTSGMLNAVITPFFEEATHKMVDAFEQRAAQLYKAD